jgi:hypothetical protein
MVCGLLLVSVNGLGSTVVVCFVGSSNERRKIRLEGDDSMRDCWVISISVYMTDGITVILNAFFIKLLYFEVIPSTE